MERKSRVGEAYLGVLPGQLLDLMPHLLSLLQLVLLSADTAHVSEFDHAPHISHAHRHYVCVRMHITSVSQPCTAACSRQTASGSSP